ncbi:hypothetical protein CXK97_09605 [Stutzerimonas stutzeri]|nr:hypothetical protein CXK97_09605 [Stutzerimonas stutzeri]
MAGLFFVGAVSTAKRLQEASWLKMGDAFLTGIGRSARLSSKARGQDRSHGSGWRGCFFVGAVSTAKRLQEAPWLKIRVRIFDRQVGPTEQQKLAVKTAPTGWWRGCFLWERS